jgi:hypothetical protein
MRYPPLLIAIFLAMILKPFAGHLGPFALSGVFFSLLIFFPVIYAFRGSGVFAVCLALLETSSVTLRLVADHWQVNALLMVSFGLSVITMLLVMIASSGWLGLFPTIGSTYCRPVQSSLCRFVQI